MAQLAELAVPQVVLRPGEPRVANARRIHADGGSQHRVAMARCVAASPTGPNVSPNGWATNTARDGLMIAVISATCVIDIVHSPASSRTRWISPTDC